MHDFSFDPSTIATNKCEGAGAQDFAKIMENPVIEFACPSHVKINLHRLQDLVTNP